MHAGPKDFVAVKIRVGGYLETTSELVEFRASQGS